MARAAEAARAALGQAAEEGTWRRLGTSPGLAAVVTTVRERAARARATPIAEIPASMYDDYARTGDRAAFEVRYFERRTRLAVLALDALLDAAAESTELAAAIEAILAEPQWALPAHVGPREPGDPVLDPRDVIDLFAAETGSALAEITTLLAGRLPAALVERTHAAVRERVVASYERHTFWWEDFPNNWAAVCAGSVALAALQVCDVDRVRALLPRLRASLRRSLDGYGEDGVCVEGYGYWRYGFGYHLVAVTALDDAFGPDPDGEPARAAEAARWPLRAFLSGRALVPFADTWLEGTVDDGLLAGARRRYGGVGAVPVERREADPVDDCGRWALALRSLCWRAEGDAVHDLVDTGDAPRWYPDAQWLVVPEGAHSPIGFAARAGHNGEPHNNNDLGSVVVAHRGEMLVADAGRGVYDKAYFGPQRYDNPAAGSHGHGVPLLDDVRQATGPQARAVVLEVAIDDDGESLAIDLTAAYPHPALRRLVRRVVRHGAVVTVTDTMTASAPIALTQRFVSLVPPVVEEEGVTLAGRRARAVLQLPPGATATTGSFPVGRGSFPMPVHHVDVVSVPATDVERTVTIVVQSR